MTPSEAIGRLLRVARGVSQAKHFWFATFALCAIVLASVVYVGVRTHAPRYGDVTHERVLAAERNPRQWLTHYGD